MNQPCEEKTLCNAIFAICEKIDDATYRLLKRNEKRYTVLHYYSSKSCNNVAAKLLNGLVKLAENMEKMNIKVAGIDRKVEEMRKGQFTEDMIETVKEITREQTEAKLEKDIMDTESRQ